MLYKEVIEYINRALCKAIACIQSQPTHLVEVVFCNAVLINVADALHAAHVEHVHLLHVLRAEPQAHQQLPYGGRQVEIEGLLGPDGHPQQDSYELVLLHVGLTRQARVEQVSAQSTTSRLYMLH